jgi:hypothetical protein
MGRIMKYYTYELWEKLNSEKSEERKLARNELTKNGEEYFEQFKIVKNKLPKSFIEKYMKYDGFHDFKLEDIIISNQVKQPINVDLTVLGEGKKFRIEYSGIKNFSINYLNEKGDSRYQNGFDAWGYCEFFELSHKVFSHEILFASGAIILIHFKKIKIIEIKTEVIK